MVPGVQPVQHQQALEHQQAQERAHLEALLKALHTRPQPARGARSKPDSTSLEMVLCLAWHVHVKGADVPGGT